MNIIKYINFNYALKAISIDELAKENMINNATLLYPTPLGLQSCEVIVIKNQKLMKKIIPFEINQSIKVNLSQLSVFTAWNSFSRERKNNHFSYINKQKGMLDSIKDEYLKMMRFVFNNEIIQQNIQKTVKKLSTSKGFMNITSDNELIDSFKLKGNNSNIIYKLLNFNNQGLKNNAILTLRFKDEKTNCLLRLNKMKETLNKHKTINQ